MRDVRQDVDQLTASLDRLAGLSVAPTKTQIVFGSGRLQTWARKTLGPLGAVAVAHARNLG
eukprot:2509598-Prorocentrum_lima.AAC.1